MFNGYQQMPMYNSNIQQQLAQQRMEQLQNQYNGMMQQTVPQQTMQIIKCRPVSSYDEAKASMIDLDGSMFVFTDIANKKIYTKQILLDGSAELKTYILQENNVEQNNNDVYVLKTDFDNIINSIRNSIEEMKGVKADDSTNVKRNDEWLFWCNNAIQQMQFAQQNCCCETNRNIDSVKYENARNTCNIVNAIKADGDATRALMTQNEIQSLRDQLQTANFQLSQQAQSANIINQLRPTPIPAYVTCSPYELSMYANGRHNTCGC